MTKLRWYWIQNYAWLRTIIQPSLVFVTRRTHCKEIKTAKTFYSFETETTTDVLEFFLHKSDKSEKKQTIITVNPLNVVARYKNRRGVASCLNFGQEILEIKRQKWMNGTLQNAGINLVFWVIINVYCNIENLIVIFASS